MSTAIWVVIIWSAAGLVAALIVGQRFKKQKESGFYPPVPKELSELPPAELEKEFRHYQEREQERARQREAYWSPRRFQKRRQAN